MDTLNGLDTAGTEPLYSPVEQPTPLREDKVVKRFAREDIVSNAPETDGKFFIVLRLFNGGVSITCHFCTKNP